MLYYGYWRDHPAQRAFYDAFIHSHYITNELWLRDNASYVFFTSMFGRRGGRRGVRLHLARYYRERHRHGKARQRDGQRPRRTGEGDDRQGARRHSRHRADKINTEERPWSFFAPAAQRNPLSERKTRGGPPRVPAENIWENTEQRTFCGAFLPSVCC